MINYSKAAFISIPRYEYVTIKSKSPFSIAGGGFGSTTVSVPHNLGYKPYFKAWYTFDDVFYYRAFSGTGSYDLHGNGMQVDSISVTTTDLVFNLSNFAVPAITGTIHYRIYAEPQQ